MIKFSVLTLRVITILTLGFGGIICILALPSFGTAIARNLPEFAILQYPILIGLYSAAGCFFFGLYQFWLLLNGVQKEGELSVKRLKAIRMAGIALCALYAIFAMPTIYLAADAQDAPGLILIGLYIGSLPLGVASVASLLEVLSRKNNRISA